MRLHALELPAETGPGVPPPSSQGGSPQNTMSTRSAGTAVEALQSPHLYTRPIMDSLIPSANIYDASYVPGTVLGARSWGLPYVREKGKKKIACFFWKMFILYHEEHLWLQNFVHRRVLEAAIFLWKGEQWKP